MEKNYIFKIKDYQTIKDIKDKLTEYDREGNLNEFLIDLKKGKLDFFFDNSKIEKGNIEITKKLNTVSNDFDASKILFEELKQLTYEEAHDERLWCYLSLYYYRDYCINKFNSSTRDKKLITYFRRFFIDGTATHLSFTRNYISGLYWTAKKTYDENLHDPFEYTQKIYSSSQLTFDLMERFDFLKNKMFFQAYIDLLFDLKEVKPSINTEFSKLMSPIMLNHYKNHFFTGLSKEEIRDELNSHYDFQYSLGRISTKRT